MVWERAIQRHLSFGYAAQHFQPLVKLGVEFSCPWFYSTGPIADALLCNRLEERRCVFGDRVRETLSDPFDPEVYGMLEVQLLRMHAGARGCLVHQEANQIVGTRSYRKLPFAHYRSAAVQQFDTESGGDVARISFDLLSVRVQLAQLSVALRASIRWNGRPHQACDIDSAHGQPCRKGFVVSPSHPVRLCRGLLSPHDMVVDTGMLAGAEVGDLRTFLLEQYIQRYPSQAGYAVVVTVKGCRLGKRHWREKPLESTIRPQLAAFRVDVRPNLYMEYRSRGQTEARSQRHLREFYSVSVAGRLRIAALVVRGVRHVISGVVAEFQRQNSPALTGSSLEKEQICCGAHQACEHLRRKPPRRPTVPDGWCTRAFKCFGHALGDSAVYDYLTRTVLGHDMFQKHRRYHHRRILPLAVLRQQRPGLLHQLRLGKCLVSAGDGVSAMNVG